MSSEMTEFAQKLAEWIFYEKNSSSAYSIEKIEIIQNRTQSSYKLAEDCSFSLAWEILALHDLDQAFRATSGAGSRSLLGAANKQLEDLLWDPDSHEEFDWAALMDKVKFSSTIENFNSRDHYRIMFLLYLQIIICFATTQEHTAKAPSSQEEQILDLKNQLKS